MDILLWGKEDSKIIAPICWYILLSSICVFGREMISSFVAIPKIMFTIIRFAVPLILFLRAFKYLTLKSKICFFLLEVLFALSYIFSYFQGYMMQELILEYTVTTSCICIPAFALAMNLRNSELVHKQFLKVSYISSIILIIYLIVTINTVRYSMSATYSMLFCLIIQTNELFRRTKKRALILFLIILQIMLVFLRGSRGPLLCYALYLIIKSVINARQNRRLFIFLLMSAFALVLIGINLNTIFQAMSKIFEKLNVTSRTLEGLLNATILEDSGRGYFKGIIREYIRQRPIIGYGASSDVYLAEGYPHSLLLELCFDFGIPVGATVFLLLTIAAVKVFLYQEKSTMDCALVFFSCGYFMLMLSGTYLQNIYVFALLGLSLNPFIKAKIRFIFAGSRRNNNDSYAEKRKEGAFS